MVVVGDWHLKEELGRGSFAQVKLAVHKTTKQQAAVKVLSKEELTDMSKEQIKREITVLKKTDHPNVCKLLDVMETSRNVYLVLELVNGGDFSDYIERNAPLKPELAKEFMKQLISGVHHMHTEGDIVHRDLKPANLMLQKDAAGGPPILKITDMGLSRMIEPTKKLQTICGTPAFVAPEVLRSGSTDGYEGPPCDAWSCGVILYNMLTGQLPFATADPNDVKSIFARVLSGQFTPLPASVPAGAAELVKGLLQVDPKNRLSLANALRSPWLNS